MLAVGVVFIVAVIPVLRTTTHEQETAKSQNKQCSGHRNLLKHENVFLESFEVQLGKKAESEDGGEKIHGKG